MYGTFPEHTLYTLDTTYLTITGHTLLFIKNTGRTVLFLNIYTLDTTYPTITGQTVLVLFIKKYTHYTPHTQQIPDIWYFS